MIHSICAKLALPLLLVGAVGCQQPAPKKPSAPPPHQAGSAVTAPPASMPVESKVPLTTPSVVKPTPTPIAPAPSVSTPATAPAAPAPAPLSAGAATTAPVIVGESGAPVVAAPQDLGPELTQSLDAANTSKPLPSKVDTSRSYMDTQMPTLPGTSSN